MEPQKTPLWVIKIGGSIMDDPRHIHTMVKTVAQITTPRILIHGGGKQATQLAEQLGIPVEMVKGRRITSADMLKVVTMVYGGLMNKTMVAHLNAAGTPAIGLTGVDNQLIIAHKRPPVPIDFGFVGDIDRVNHEFLVTLLNQNLTPVIAPLTVTYDGQILNTNADTIATEIAIALSGKYAVHLVLCLDRPGVLANPEEDGSLIHRLSFAEFQKLKFQGSIHTGMVPKLDNGFRALNLGVQSVTLCHFTHLQEVIEGKSTGTQLQR